MSWNLGIFQLMRRERKEKGPGLRVSFCLDLPLFFRFAVYEYADPSQDHVARSNHTN